MQADEVGTLAAFKARRRDVLKPLVAKHPRDISYEVRYELDLLRREVAMRSVDLAKNAVGIYEQHLIFAQLLFALPLSKNVQWILQRRLSKLGKPAKWGGRWFHVERDPLLRSIAELCGRRRDDPGMAAAVLPGLLRSGHRRHISADGSGVSNADAENAAGKQRGRPFRKGRSGNPSGKAKGTRHKATIQALLEGEAEVLTRKCYRPGEGWRYDGASALHGTSGTGNKVAGRPFVDACYRDGRWRAEGSGCGDQSNGMRRDHTGRGSV